MSAILQWYYAVLAASKKPVASWWLSGGINPVNAIAAYQPKGASSQAASYSNLANTALYNAAPGVAPTWTPDDGWIFNGTSQYLTTGITPSVTWSCLVRFSGGLDNSQWQNKYLFGMFNGAGKQFGIVPVLGTVPTKVQYENAGIAQIGPLAVSGVLGFAGKQPYRDGVAEIGVISAGSVIEAAFYIGARNRADTGSVDSFIPAVIQAFAIYDTTLTAAQVLAVTQAMQAL